MRDVGGGAEKEAASAAVAFKPTTQQNTKKEARMEKTEIGGGEKSKGI